MSCFPVSVFITCLVSHICYCVYILFSMTSKVIAVMLSQGVCLKRKSTPTQTLQSWTMITLVFDSTHGTLLCPHVLHLFCSHPCSLSMWFSCAFSCPVAALPGTGGFPSSRTGTSGFPTACPPGPRHSPHPASPPETTGDSICTKDNKYSDV